MTIWYYHKTELFNLFIQLYDPETVTLDLIKLKSQEDFLQSSNHPCGEPNSGSQNIFPPVSTPLPSTPQLSGLYTNICRLVLTVQRSDDMPVLIYFQNANKILEG